jgi:hypothetical protein
MEQTIFGVLNSPEIYQKLFAELKEAFPSVNDEITFLKLEALPYFVSAPFLQ